MESEDLYKLRATIMDRCRQATTTADSTESNKKEFVRVIKETYQLHGEKTWDVLMSIRGLVLRHRLAINQISVLSSVCWSIGEGSADETEGSFFRRVAMSLKPKACEIFRGPLSGGEVFYHNGTGKKRYSFTRIPEDIRLLAGVRFSISRVNTHALLGTYDSLIKKAGEEENDPMVNHWKIQKQVFTSLLEDVAPKLLEPKTQ